MTIDEALSQITRDMADLRDMMRAKGHDAAQVNFYQGDPSWIFLKTNGDSAFGGWGHASTRMRMGVTYAEMIADARKQIEEMAVAEAVAAMRWFEPVA